MSYSVRWVDSAVSDLAEIWLNADSKQRRQITDAAHEVDARLATSPEQQGESRPSDHRILFVAPLGITYMILAEHRIVKVLDVWKFKMR